MAKRKKIRKPNIVGGGVSIDMGNGFYKMRGRTHNEGGIDLGSRKNGLEVEDKEVVKIDKDGLKVYSSVPFINGKSPAEKVEQGEDPNKVFKQQEKFKDDNDLNDDGTKKGASKSSPSTGSQEFAVGGSIDPLKARTLEDFLPDEDDRSKAIYDELNNYAKGVSEAQQQANLKRQEVARAKQNEKDSKFTTEDYIGAGAGVLGATVSSLIRKNHINNLKEPVTPVTTSAAKLKTDYNINPQLDSLREYVSASTKATNHNTASSRLANARNNATRLNAALKRNELYGNKENIETQLINKDKLNSQQVTAANNSLYNDYTKRLIDFKNNQNLQRGDNSVNLVNNINSAIQSGLTRLEKRKQDIRTSDDIRAANPNVNDSILKEMQNNAEEKAKLYAENQELMKYQLEQEKKKRKAAQQSTNKPNMR